MGAEIGRYTANSINLPTNISNLDSGHRIIRNLHNAYQADNISNNPEVEISTDTFDRGGRLKWWEWISVFDTETNSKTTYRPGMVIPILEKKGRKSTDEFAEIVGYWNHKTGCDHIFFNLSWLTAIGVDKSYGGLTKYKVQRRRTAENADSDATDTDGFFHYVSL